MGVQRDWWGSRLRALASAWRGRISAERRITWRSRLVDLAIFDALSIPAVGIPGD